MTEFEGVGGGQIAGDVTGLTVAAEEVVAARPKLVWDLREVAAQAPEAAAEIIAARRDGLRANMRATLRAMKAAAESSHTAAADPG